MTSQPATPTSTVIASGDYAFYTSLVWAKLNTIRPGPARPERRADGPFARAPGPGTSAQDGRMGRGRGAGGSEGSLWSADPVVSGSIPWEAIGRFIFALAALGTGWDFHRSTLVPRWYGAWSETGRPCGPTNRPTNRPGQVKHCSTFRPYARPDGRYGCDQVLFASVAYNLHHLQKYL